VRIIGGRLKGHKIIAPKSLPVRPTTDFAKEALFNILNNRIDFPQVSLLDLFSGTGNISYEFGSRECPEILAVEQNFQCLKYINKTASDFDLPIHTFKADVFKFLVKKNHKSYSVIFADPPYQNKKLIDIPDLVFNNEWLAPNGLLIMEHGPYTSFSDHKNFVELRKYGNVNFSFFE
jgi:16S rRNA (guanine(966)-N(2))-methyltransferase RsmD|tara:strand:- start:1070 stop:1600 length:531 start_codon:yes stop_codon:yes gene_type:complete